VPAENRNLLGQKMGRKGRDTRQRIMDAALELLKTYSYKDLNVSEIVSEADVSNATFYVYFTDVEEVLFACVQAAAMDLGELHAVLDAEWSPHDVREQVKKFVDIYNELWEKYRVELRVRNLEADQGNLRFLNLRIETTKSLLQKLSNKIAKLNPDLEYPQQIAVAIHAAMSGLAAQHDIGITGATRQTRKKLNAGVTEIILTLLKM
jgi:AcrR family transcriptional regulator